MRNPMDSYRDIFPWPYGWSRDLAAPVIRALAAVDFLYENLDKWTYGRHWTFNTDWDRPDPEYVVDLYWSDEGEERLQLPPPVGDHVAQLLTANNLEGMRVLIWMGRIWTPAGGWKAYTGPQGDFVDHIHIEFDQTRHEPASWREGQGRPTYELQN